ncbi:MAG: RHS repeat-associated core domain-containing protein [Bryobacterales bacterium]|nr:RHS repeat-associated core domain-containing protein [Bryobacterales bacterium]
MQQASLVRIAHWLILMTALALQARAHFPVRPPRLPAAKSLSCGFDVTNSHSPVVTTTYDAYSRNVCVLAIRATCWTVATSSREQLVVLRSVRRSGQFTGKERDAETGLDYFGARYFSGVAGRFTSADAPFADQHPSDPQSWNLYSYVRNNPLRYTDPTGHCLYSGADCFQYLFGAAKAVANIPSNTATLINRGINALTGFSIPDAPRLEGANYDQRAGMDAANVTMLVSPLVELGAARLSGVAGTTARVEAGTVAAEGSAPKLLSAPKVRGNPNTADVPAKVMVDAKGNAIPLKPGESLTGSPDGRFLQVRDAQGKPTGMRLDGPHKPNTHPDPRAQRPHAHVPGVTNPDGTPWLPVNR